MERRAFVRRLAVAALIVPPLACLLYILRFGVNLPWGDEWDGLVPFLGGWTFTDLFRAQTGHRVFFPLLLQLIVARFSHFDNRWVTYISWLFLVAIGLLFLHNHTKRIADARTRSLLFFLPALLLLFDLKQAYNLLAAWPVCIFMSVFGAIAAFHFIGRSRGVDRALGLAVASAAFSSLSFMSGLAVWAAGALQIATSAPRSDPSFRQRLRSLIPWCAAAVLVFVAQLNDEMFLPQSSYSFLHPQRGIAFFLITIGNPLAQRPMTAGIVGAVLLLLSGFVLWRLMASDERDPFLVSVMAFSLASSLMETIGRASQGGDLANNGRYATLTIPGLIALYLGFDRLRAHSRAATMLHSGMAALIVMSSGASTAPMIEYARRFQRDRAQVARALLQHRIPPAESIGDWLDPTVVASGAAELERQRLSIFRSEEKVSATALLSATPPTYALDGIADHFLIDRGSTIHLDVQGPLTIKGWAVDTLTQGPAAAVTLILGEKRFRAFYGIPRRDVVRTLGTRRECDCGFQAILFPEALTSGSFPVSIEVLSASGDARNVAATGYQLVIDSISAYPPGK